METIKTVGYFIQVEYEDFSVYRYREEFRLVPNEGPPLETGLYGEDDPYLEQFEANFKDSTVGALMSTRHGDIISLKIVR